MKYLKIFKFKILFLLMMVTSAFAFVTDPNSFFFNANPPAKPGYLTRILDTTYQTYYRRVTADSTDPTSDSEVVTLDSGQNIGKWGNRSRHVYSKIQAWNADQTLIYITNTDCPYQSMLCAGPGLFLDGNGWGDTYKVKFSATRPLAHSNNGDGEERWHPTNPDLRIYTGRNLDANNANGVLVVGSWNVRTGAETVFREFPEYTRIQMGPWEGNLSNDGSWVAIVGTKSNGQKAVFAYNMNSNTKMPEIDISTITLDWASISPLGNYIVVNGCWDSYANCMSGSSAYIDRSWVLSKSGGTITGSNPTAIVGWWNEYARPSHYDLAVDDNGHEVAVGVSRWSTAMGAPSGEEGKVIKRRLSNGQVTRLTFSGYASHTSTRNINRPGWAYVSYGYGSGPFKDEVIAVRLNGSGQVERWMQFYDPGEVESLSDTENFWAQPHASPSPSGNRVIWASKWGKPFGPINAYIAEH